MKRLINLFIISILFFSAFITNGDQKTTKNETESYYATLVPWIISGGTEISSFPLYKPYSLAIDMDGNVYILDIGNSCIVKYDKNGRFIKNWGHQGQGPGELGVSPLSTIRFDKKGNLAVVERQFNQRISFFDKEGNYLRSFRTERPVDSISFDSKNNIFVSIEGNTKNDNLIIKYDQNGSILDKFSKVFIEDRSQNYHTSLLVHDSNDNLYQIFTHFPYIRKYDLNNILIFQKEIDLEGHFSKETKEIWSKYNFISPSNKFGESWMMFCKKAIYFPDMIFLLKPGSIMKISLDGKYISEKIYREGYDIKFGLLNDFAIISKENILTTFIGKECVGIGVFIF